MNLTADKRLAFALMAVRASLREFGQSLWRAVARFPLFQRGRRRSRGGARWALPALADGAARPSGQQPSLNSLSEQCQKAFADAEALLQTADNEQDGVLTDEQSQQFDALMEEYENLRAQIARRSRFREAEEATSRSTGRVTAPAQPMTGRISDMRTPAERDPWGGFRDASDFGRAVREASRPGGSVDHRLLELPKAYGVEASSPSTFHRESVGEDGGWMVPPQMRQEIWELVFEEPGIFNMTDQEPTSSNSVELLADETTPWGSSGVQAHWIGEAEQMTASKAKTEPRLTRMKKLAALVKATDEVLADAPRLNALLTRKSAQAINWKLDDSVLYGDGVNQPLGYNNSDALVVQAKDDDQEADTISVNNISAMKSRLLRVPGSTPVWIGNSDVEPQLIQLTIGQQPVYVPLDQGIQQQFDARLLGFPVRWTEHAKTLGDQGDLQLASLRGYHAIRKEGGIEAATSIHLWFDWNLTAFRWTVRVGGQPYLAEPVSPPNGTNTKSHFVVLAARD